MTRSEPPDYGGPTDHAAREARPFLFPKEDVLDDDYPVHAGFLYVIETTDGEVFPYSSDVSGTTLDIKLARSHGKTVRFVRRCNIFARQTANQED